VGPLPSSLTAIAEFPKAYRKEIFLALNLEQKQALWKEQLETYLLPASSLNEVQRRMVAALPIELGDKERLMIRKMLDTLPTLFSSKLTDQERKQLSGELCAFIL